MWWLWPHFKRIWALAATVIAGLTINYLFALWGEQSVPSLRGPSDGCGLIRLLQSYTFAV